MKIKITKDMNKACKLLGWLACHADEDCPSENRSKHFKVALDEAVNFLEDSGWYEFNKKNKGGNQ